MIDVYTTEPGDHYKKDGSDDVWELESYCIEPTVSLRNARTGESTGMCGISGITVASFKKVEKPVVLVGVSLSLPKIYCFSNTEDGGEGTALALAEDGTILANHFCSNEDYVSHDLGVNSDGRRGPHEAYKAHYPNGYEMVFVRRKELTSHNGYQIAQRAYVNNHVNKAKAIEAEEEPCPACHGHVHIVPCETCGGSGKACYPLLWTMEI